MAYTVACYLHVYVYYTIFVTHEHTFQTKTPRIDIPWYVNVCYDMLIFIDFHPQFKQNRYARTSVCGIIYMHERTDETLILMGETMGRKTVKITIEFDDDERADYVARHPAFTGELADVIAGVRKRANYAPQHVGWKRVVIIWQRRRVVVQPV